MLVRKIASIYPSLNIEFSKKSSLFWLIYIQSSRKLWSGTMRFPRPKPPLKVNDSFNCRTVHDNYSAYDRTSSSNVLLSVFVLCSPHGSDANTIVWCIIFYYFACCEAFFIDSRWLRGKRLLRYKMCVQFYERFRNEGQHAIFVKVISFVCPFGLAWWWIQKFGT